MISPEGWDYGIHQYQKYLCTLIQTAESLVMGKFEEGLCLFHSLSEEDQERVKQLYWELGAQRGEWGEERGAPFMGEALLSFLEEKIGIQT